jgi:hypothetical protein
MQLSGTTEKNGSWLFYGAAPGSYTIQASKSGYVTGLATVNVAKGSQTEVTIKLQAKQSDLKITVKDNVGNPISGVSVLGDRTGLPGQGLQKLTAADGTAFFSGVAPGSFFIRALKDGYLPSQIITVMVTVGTLSEAVITMVPETAIRVIVNDASNNSPLSGATVSTTSQPTGRATLNGSTDTSGVVEFKGIQSGSYTLQISKLGYSSVSNIVVADLGATKEVTFSLSAHTIDLRITVKDGTGKPLSGVKVEASTRPQGQGGLNMNTDSNGVAWFAGVKPGSYVFKLSKPKYMISSLPLEVTPGLPYEASATLLSSSSAFFGLWDEEEGSSYLTVVIGVVAILGVIGLWLYWQRRHP